ncbi:MULTISPECIES: hypothetical protein [Calothrix]|uniref:Phage terminase large subunit n=2 Tax=Calothrix TaxID=1186 RepID=A0ABR8AAZ1_9CYAN|nr:MULTISPECIES: hypothetical protein [Calothrix]MBD2196605.1 hypothetical protein [Calothrix parietina FACHB-288]MBD2228030.1 hypothetical protein [Calothrix anomala FACHB-343]
MMMNLSLHKKQAEVFLSKARFKLLIAARRWGKSRLLLTSAIHAALSFNQSIDPASPPVCLIVMPTLKQCRQIHWQPLLNLLENQPFVESISRTDFRIKLKGNKPDILLRGADNNGDGLRGLKLYWAGLDEFQDFSIRAWEDVVYPALADTANSKALLIGTPKGKAHFLHRFHLQIKTYSDWAYYHFITKDNPFVPKRFLNRAKIILPPRTYRQEFEASFEDFTGAIFDCIDSRHIVADIPSEFDHTFLGCDWGDINPALVVVGYKDKKYYLIDSWSNPHPGNAVPQADLITKAIEFCNKYKVRRAYLPDDRPASIFELRKVGKSRDIEGLKKAIAVDRNKPGISEGCTIVNSLFYQDRLLIKSTQTKLEDSLRSYVRETDSSGNVIDKPAKNQECAHLVDATRYVIATLEYKNFLK